MASREILGLAQKRLIPIAIGAGFASAVIYHQYRRPAAALSPVFQGEFVDLKLAKIEDVTHNSKLFTFEFPSQDQTAGLEVASCVLTKFIGSNGKPVIRPYTPVSDPDSKGSLNFIIKKYDGGAMSTHIFDLKKGDKLAVKGPILKYKWEANKHKEIALLGAGTGITPLYQLVQEITKNPADKTKVTLIYGNLSPNDIILKKQLDVLTSKFPDQFKVHYFVDKPTSDWSGNTGIITKDFLAKTIPKSSSDNIKAFVCGPPGFCKAFSGEKASPSDQGELSGALKDLGYTKNQVFKF